MLKPLAIASGFFYDGMVESALLRFMHLGINGLFNGVVEIIL